MFIAHKRTLPSKTELQTVEAHLVESARLASGFAGAFEADKWAYLCGIWHDLGKFSDAFQHKIKADLNTRVDHSTYGARHAFRQLGPEIGKLLAYVIAGHHGGLPDGRNDGQHDLEARLKAALPDMAAIPTSIAHQYKLGGLPLQHLTKRLGFQISFFIRMLFSCLKDADCLDTEKFMSPETHALRIEGPDLEVLRKQLDTHLSGFKAEQTPLNTKRNEILAACRKAASLKQGMFTLTVPTGGGKTLSSLAFALGHARKHSLRRVIYVIPYTSIIEQNAAVFRKAFGEHGATAVLEHHSNFTPKNLGRSIGKDMDDQSPEYIRSRLAAENWNAPVVTTTNVQFFESLFANRTSKCRKLHNIARSVIILDEAQMLPLQFLRPCMEALRELAANYGCTVVLCTATQPALSADEFKEGFKNVRGITDDVQGLHDRDGVFDRVRLEKAGTLSMQEAAARTAAHEQVLTIVNTRQHAQDLFEQLTDADNTRHPSARHLSARMCPAHRSEVLESIRADLAAGKPCRVISTQLIEAGVDISFPVVFREMAGLDSIAQAAGRCNREGECDTKGVIYCFQFEDGIPRPFRRVAGLTEEVLDEYPDAPFSPQAVNAFFRRHYWFEDEKLDEKRILNEFEKGFRALEFPFKEVAGLFKIIENTMLPVIIPWNTEAEALIRELRHTEYPGSTAAKLQQFTVQIYDKEFKTLENAGGIELIQDQYAVLRGKKEHYDDKLGLVPKELLPEAWFF